MYIYVSNKPWMDSAVMFSTMVWAIDGQYQPLPGNQLLTKWSKIVQCEGAKFGRWVDWSHKQFTTPFFSGCVWYISIVGSFFFTNLLHVSTTSLFPLTETFALTWTRVPTCWNCNQPFSVWTSVFLWCILSLLEHRIQNQWYTFSANHNEHL